MTVKRRFAEGTEVQPETSQAEIQRLVRRYDADGFGLMWEGDVAAVAFRAHGRRVQFTLTFPSASDPQFARTARGIRTPTQRIAAREAEIRRLWRSLAMAIKAKLEVVESGIASFESEFLAHIVLPDGTLVGDHVEPAIARAYELGVPMQLSLPRGSE